MKKEITNIIKRYKRLLKIKKTVVFGGFKTRIPNSVAESEGKGNRIYIYLREGKSLGEYKEDIIFELLRWKFNTTDNKLCILAQEFNIPNMNSIFRDWDAVLEHFIEPIKDKF